MKEQQSCYFMTSKLSSVLENSSIFIIKVSQAEFHEWNHLFHFVRTKCGTQGVTDPPPVFTFSKT